ncbi:hypothetical protein AB0J86_26950 [Micromonospora sp. NPDC049559]|uniref:hypothetical protein n=1 Tax=Micromonospora sp. NPDC049559 TaxID=3155923 RepID=UPI00344948EF
MSAARVRLIRLMLVAAVPAAIEGAVLRVIEFRSALPISPQASAVSPYGSFHDLRWLLVYHDSWAALVGEALAAIVFRGLLASALLALAWPPEVPRPGLRRLIGRNLVFAAFLLVVLAPWAGLAVVASEVSLPSFVLLELIPLLLLTPVLLRGGIVADWWRGLPSARLIGWALVAFLTPMLGGALVRLLPDGWQVMLATVAGAGNGLLWWGLVRAVLHPGRLRWRRVPVAPLLVALLVAATLVADTGAGNPGPGTPDRQPLDVLPERGETGHTVIYLDGYDSNYNGRPTPARPTVTRFSYRGLDEHGAPRPYSSADTHQSVESATNLLAVQVAELHARTGRPVALVGQSEGALVIRRYLDRRHPAVDTAVLINPLVRAGRAYYPPPGAKTGWGIGTGWLLRGMLAAERDLEVVPDSADEPFLRSLIDGAPFYRNETLCPVPGVRMIAFLASSDYLVVPPAMYAQIPILEVAGLHGTLLYQRRVSERVVDFIRGRDPISDGDRRPRLSVGDLTVQGAFGAWQAPALALAVNPVWHPMDGVDASFHGRRCPG